LLERYCPEVSVVGKASGVKSGIEAIRALHPDLVFLDMNMGDGSGFDLLHALAPVGFRVIFVSAMDKDTIRAFRLSSMEYLLKPINQDELKMTVERAMKAEIKHFSLQLEALEGNVR
jgi:two-component system LytT family response regulator